MTPVRQRGARRRAATPASDRSRRQDVPRCGLRTGVIIDHEHFTGLVRGLLCAHCNTRIDYCPHLTNRRWATYLNEPPALTLGLRHHAPKKVRKDHQKRIELLGFDPFP